MLIATLPTITGPRSLEVAANIITHPLIGAVRYNSGGDSPYTPREIIEKIKTITDQHKKQLYIDLEGRQTRIARWTPNERGSIVLNRDFTIELPAKAYIRNAGWFEIANAACGQRKLYLLPNNRFRDYYFGESQSVHVIAKQFNVKGYLGGLDAEYIHDAVSLGLNSFMLSFFENMKDATEFYEAYYAHRHAKKLSAANVVLKIESMRGVRFVRNTSKTTLSGFRIMAARDDLFTSFAGQESKIIDALSLIIKRDPNAIAASRILAGLESSGEPTLSDIEDVVLLSNTGYRHFMLSDGLAHQFSPVMEVWERTIVPLLKKERKRK